MAVPSSVVSCTAYDLLVFPVVDRDTQTCVLLVFSETTFELSRDTATSRIKAIALLFLQDSF